MTTIRTLITDALREGGIIALGETPTAAMSDEALRRVNTLFRSYLGNELGNDLVNVSYGQNGLTTPYAKATDASTTIDSSYVPENTNLLVNLSASKTVYLPPNPRDGARVAIADLSGNFNTFNLTVNANGRKIESGTTVVLNTASVVAEWFFRADLGKWVRVSALTLDDESPFPEQFDDFWSTSLALRLNPRYGQTLAPETAETLRRARSQFRARYRQSSQMDSEEALLRLPSMRGLLTYFGEPAFKFYRGY